MTETPAYYRHQMNAPTAPENVYQTDLLAYPGAWASELPHLHIHLVSDAELAALTDPDQPINLQHRFFGDGPITLRQICEKLRARGARLLTLAFDHFFAQYRGGQREPRRLTPDMDETIQIIAKISQFAETYGLGMELSLLNPLEIGPAYRRQTGECGRWLHYRKGVRDPKTGAFSVQLWQQQHWVNNKGVFAIDDAGVRVFAFHEEAIPGTPYKLVDPDSIVEITHLARVEPLGDLSLEMAGYRSRRIRVFGEGRTAADEAADPKVAEYYTKERPLTVFPTPPEFDNPPWLNRVLVVQQYDTPEMDYFSDKALPFLTGLLDRYLDAGVKLDGLYSDEMHIQQDWGYYSHQDNGSFAMRYASDGLVREFARRWGSQYADFAKYMIYFVYGQEDAANDLTAREGVMHVFGASPEAIRETALFRARYFHLLQDTVTDLCVAAKRYAERRIGYRLEARYHATWAESPTHDQWRAWGEDGTKLKYEYTNRYVWSNTAHQAAAACQDYFKWGEFMTGGGNDHAEGGWLDRNYFGMALGCSLGILNDPPNAYAGCWGIPGPVRERRGAVNNVYGAAAEAGFGMVQERQHRDTDVLMLYPLDLVAVEERFGTWMTQYGYANMITPDKLLERGRVVGGTIEVASLPRPRVFKTLVAVFEPFPSQALLDMMWEFVMGGGRLIWSGPPPVLTFEGTDALETWQILFGVDYPPSANEGRLAPGRMIHFEGALAGVKPEVILTDFLVDRIYAVTPRSGTEVVGRDGAAIVATMRSWGEGKSIFLGFRPRDDQSASLGYETRQWFEILAALGAYPATGRFADANDNPDFVARASDVMAARFPNGAVALAPHYRSIEENWEGGFERDASKDAAWLATLPSFDLRLREFKIAGHTVSYEGVGAMSFRLDAQGGLEAIAGQACRAIEVDGRRFEFAEAPMASLAWAPVPESRRVEGGAYMIIMGNGPGRLRLPVAGLPEKIELVLEGPTPGTRGATIPCRYIKNHLEFELTTTTTQDRPWTVYAVGR